MADDDRKADAPEKGDTPKSDKPVPEATDVAGDSSFTAGRFDPSSLPSGESKTNADVKTEPHRLLRPGSEWTASDDRGPLGRAEDDEAVAVSHSEASVAGDRGDTAHAPDLAAMMPTSTPAEPVPPVDAIASAGGSAGAARSATTTSAAAEPRRTSLWPVAASLIIGALIGAGSAAFVYRGYADDSQPDPHITSLQARLDALEKRPDPQSSIAGLKSSVTALDNQVAVLRKTAGTTGTTTSAAASPSDTPSPTPVDLGPVNDKIAALQSKLDGLASRGGDTKALQEKITALEGTLAATKRETDSARAGVSNVEGQQKALAGKVLAPALAVVADSLVQQIDRGQPYAAQVDALAALGADPAKIAVLRRDAANGVPSAGVLAARFEPLVLPITTTAHKAPANAGLVDRLKSGMFSMVSIRRADDTSGTDLPSRVARIRAALTHDDVAGALEAWNALPPDAKAKADAWAALAKTHVDAMTAARALQHDAIAALATQKS